MKQPLEKPFGYVGKIAIIGTLLGNIFIIERFVKLIPNDYKATFVLYVISLTVFFALFVPLAYFWLLGGYEEENKSDIELDELAKPQWQITSPGNLEWIGTHFSIRAKPGVAAAFVVYWESKVQGASGSLAGAKSLAQKTAKEFLEVGIDI